MSLTRFLGTRNDTIVDELKRIFPYHPPIYGSICFSMVQNDAVLLNSLKERKTYLRIFSKKDLPNSKAYLECYIREINNMLPEQKLEGLNMLNYSKDENIILIELCYVTVGFFFLYNIKTGEAYQPF